MANYFMAKNDNDTVIVDDNTVFYHLYQKKLLSEIASTPTPVGIVSSIYDSGTTISILDTGHRYSYTYTISTPSNQSLCGIISTNYTSNICYSFVKNFYNTSQYILDIYTKNASDFDPSKVTIYIFDNTAINTSDTFGLEIRNASDTRIFHSSEGVLNIASQGSITDGDTTGYQKVFTNHKNTTITVPSGKTYAYIPVYTYALGFIIWDRPTMSRSGISFPSANTLRFDQAAYFYKEYSSTSESLDYTCKRLGRQTLYLLGNVTNL